MSVAYNPSIVRDGLVLCLDAGNTKSYPGSGTTWSDLSGNGNNGTLVNGVGYNSGNGGSLVFDGTNDYIDAGNSSSVNIVNEITISSWIHFLSLPSATGNPSIVDKWDWPNNLRSFIFGTESGNITASVSYDGSFSNRIVCYDTSPSLNVWINLVMTYDNQTLSLYKNSSFISSSSYNQVRNIYSNQSTNIFLMRSRGTEGSIRFLNAKLSQVQVYNRSLTASEIQQNYNATKSRFQ